MPLVSALTEITVDTKCWVVSWIPGQPAPQHVEEGDPLTAFDEIAEDLGLGRRRTALWMPMAKTLGDPLTALDEIAEDLVLGRCRAALWMPMAMTLALGPSAAGTVCLCGFAVSTKASYLAVSAIMALGAYSMSKRTPEEPDRTVHRQSTLALATAGLMRLLGLYLAGPHGVLAAHGVRPEVVMYFMQDLIISPVLILNMGHLVGLGPRDVGHCIGWSLLSTVSAIGAAAAPMHGFAMPLFLLSFSSIGLAGQAISRLPEQDGTISPMNNQRGHIVSDLIILSWTLAPLVHGLGLSNMITVDQQVHMFGMLDVICKMGACHIMLRDRDVLRMGLGKAALSTYLPLHLHIVQPALQRVFEVAWRRHPRELPGQLALHHPPFDQDPHLVRRNSALYVPRRHRASRAPGPILEPFSEPPPESEQ